MAELVIRTLGEQPYPVTWEAMKAFTAGRCAATTDELWFLEHPRVYTQGQAGKAEHILAPGDIPVVQVDRGGQVTYHGPGQLVVYLLLDLNRRKLGVRALIDAIEQAIVLCLEEIGIDAAPRSDAPGVYVGDAKIASLGLRVRRGCSFHGMALNVDMDMEPFSRINPCGFAGMPMCQARDFTTDVNMQVVSERLSVALADLLAVQTATRITGW